MSDPTLEALLAKLDADMLAYRESLACLNALIARLPPVETPLDLLHRCWRLVSPEDRRRFLTDVLTLPERQALLATLKD